MNELTKQEPDGKPRLQLGTMTYKGINILKCEIEEIQKMDMRDDDIWVCTYPRSGTTLTQELVYLIRTLDFDTAKFVQLDYRFPEIDVKDDRFPYYRGGDSMDTELNNHSRIPNGDLVAVKARYHGVKFVDQMTSPRMVKAHAHYDFLPEQLQNGKGRIIYVARNPKDVIISYYNLLLWLDEVGRAEMSGWNSFFQSFIDGTVHYCPWPRHVLKYWERRKDDNLLFLKYEDIIKDLPKGVRKIAAFLERTISDDDVSRICEHCSVDNMRKNDKVNMSYWRDIKHVNDKAQSRFINQGKAGLWKEKLTTEEAEKVDELIKEVEKFGLTFDDKI